MNGKRWVALGLALGLMVISTGVSFVSSLFWGDVSAGFEEIFSMEEEFGETIIEEGNSSNKIAVLEVDGVIQDTGGATSFFESPGYNHQFFLDQLEKVKEDSYVKGIVLRVNTPGGGTAESAQIHEMLVEIKEETEKPIYVSMGSIAASGGYYISAPADKIFASQETLTGSLGVILQSVNYSGLAEKYGVEFVTIKSGPYKDILSPSRPVSNEEREILQAMIDNSYDAFVEVIANGRGMKEGKVRELADGRIYDGVQAKEVNLIDEFGYLDDVIDAMKADFDLGNAQVVQYEDSAGLGSLFEMSAQKIGGTDFEMTALMKMLGNPNAPRLLYLYSE
ncbi:signal peptide peptidase SppA [Bacillus sp. 2205SS5-2]|uniref:signal peptide peptidase SppA n=1 Tax=Bacillus sp. 2205SS5-2 TaxID=3109031 RepID=UPI0030044D56